MKKNSFKVKVVSWNVRKRTKIKDLMISHESLPCVPEGTPMTEAVVAIDRGGLGAALVVNQHNKLSGIITDGDIRRMVVSDRPVSELTVEDVMTKNPRNLKKDIPTPETSNGA